MESLQINSPASEHQVVAQPTDFAGFVAVGSEELAVFLRKKSATRRTFRKEDPWHTSTRTRNLVGPRCSTWQTSQ
jgi:hypothetical protein